MRENIVAKMFACNNKVIIKQYTRSITTIARFDYPERWPTLLATDITTALNSQNEKGTITGLLALFGLVKKYEYELEEERMPLYWIVEQIFPMLGNLIN